MLEAVGLAGLLTTIVTADAGSRIPRVTRRALERLGGGLLAEEVVAFEDTEARVASARLRSTA